MSLIPLSHATFNPASYVATLTPSVATSNINWQYPPTTLALSSTPPLSFRPDSAYPISTSYDTSAWSLPKSLYSTPSSLAPILYIPPWTSVHSHIPNNTAQASSLPIASIYFQNPYADALARVAAYSSRPTDTPTADQAASDWEPLVFKQGNNTTYHWPLSGSTAPTQTTPTTSKRPSMFSGIWKRPKTAEEKLTQRGSLAGSTARPIWPTSKSDLISASVCPSTSNGPSAPLTPLQQKLVSMATHFSSHTDRPDLHSIALDWARSTTTTAQSAAEMERMATYHPASVGWEFDTFYDQKRLVPTDGRIRGRVSTRAAEEFYNAWTGTRI